nr:hypothetical protein [Candidatus Sigynarchaeota archaeon]
SLDEDTMKRQIQDGLQDFVFKKRKLFLDFKVYLTSLHKDFRQATFRTLLEITTNSLTDII